MTTITTIKQKAYVILIYVNYKLIYVLSHQILCSSDLRFLFSSTPFSESDFTYYQLNIPLY